MTHHGKQALLGGTIWHCAAALCLLVATPAGAQEPQAPGEAATEEPQDGDPGDATVPAAASAAPPDGADVAQPAAGAADALSVPAPSATPTPALDEERPPAHARELHPEAPPGDAAPQRPRGWRLPRENVRRPLTLPQGVLRFDSTVVLSAGLVPSGSRLYMSGYAAVSAGLFDDFELGATPLGITWIPLGAYFADPYVYGRVRALSGDAQIAFRAGTTLPVVSQVGVARMELGAELAFLVTPIFRIDTGVDYALLFSSPLHQRIGVPVTGTVQLGIQALALTVGVYVFNDFDDVDVPLLLRYTVTFRGYQGPHGEWALEGGFTDLENAENAWTVQSRFTFFVYP